MLNRILVALSLSLLLTACPKDDGDYDPGYDDDPMDDTDGGGARLVDCLTLWLSNLLHAGRNWSDETALLTAALRLQKSPVILVTNEVGLGIVPDNVLARAFRDAAGLLNQRVAEIADEVEFVVAGLPMKVK